MSEQVKTFAVPDLGEGLEDATLTSWSVEVGDHVELNETLCTLETAKAEVEIPSPYAGRIVERHGAVGEVLPVGSVLVRIETAHARSDMASADARSDMASADARSEVAPESSQTHGRRKPVLVGYGTDDEMDTSRRGRPRAAPAVRKLAKDMQVDLTALQPGSGADGVITRQDVLAQPDSKDDVSSVTGVRARMAERMTLSRRNIPDAHTSVEVDGTPLLRLQERFSAAGVEVSPFVLTLRLLTIALVHHPVLNSTWVDSDGGPQVRLHGGINLGVAVAASRGLLVPVVVGAESMTTRQLASRVADLVHGARNGTLKPLELQGSTFTVSNFGALGLDDGVPVINYPEAAILGMGSLKPRPVVVDGEVVVRSTMRLTCAFDHRIADGAQVAQFLCELRQLIEAPEAALLDL